MKKTLLAVAVAAALPAAAFAQTNVTLSGFIKNGYTNYRLSNGTGAVANDSGNAISDGSSRVIVGGTEDLGGGLKAIFQYDSRLRADEQVTGQNTWGGGNSFVGLAGNFGQVRIGRLDQYYGTGIDNHGVSATSLQHSSISVLSYVGGAGVTIANATRTPNLVRFDSANYSGFTFGLGYSFAGATSSSTEGYGAAGKGSALSADAKYAAGPLMVALSYWDAKVEDKSVAHKGVRVAGTYDFGFMTAGLTVDQSKQEITATSAEIKRTAYSIPLTAKLGPGTAMFTFTSAGDVKGNAGVADSGAKMYTVGYEYPLSKRTSLGVSYAVLNNDKNASYALFTGAALSNMPVPTAGQDTKSFYVGVKHNF